LIHNDRCTAHGPRGFASRAGARDRGARTGNRTFQRAAAPRPPRPSPRDFSPSIPASSTRPSRPSSSGATTTVSGLRVTPKGGSEGCFCLRARHCLLHRGKAAHGDAQPYSPKKGSNST
jgi:hypothetical protein